MFIFDVHADFEVLPFAFAVKRPDPISERVGAKQWLKSGGCAHFRSVVSMAHPVTGPDSKKMGIAITFNLRNQVHFPIKIALHRVADG